ncbi:MAG TPA: hypothetical protein VK906_09005 [Egicoccus sp.]|nr:hypothetical protein [Egicoccus sp.]HSK23301.1 hypothetical protein [Egicoccus sp.]
MVVEDVATVFYGFDDPAYVVQERVSELYLGVPGDSSDQERRGRSLTSTSGVAEGRLLVEVGAYDEGANEPEDVRCFTYRLDEARQEAALEDITVGECAALASG